MISIVEEPVIAFFTSVNQAIEVVVMAREILLAARFFAVARLYYISLAPGFQKRFEPRINQCNLILSKGSINQRTVTVERQDFELWCCSFFASGEKGLIAALIVNSRD